MMYARVKRKENCKQEQRKRNVTCIIVLDFDNGYPNNEQDDDYGTEF